METKVIFSRKGIKRNGYVTEDLENADEWDKDDDEDDVFMEDPVIDHSSATKPLMHPRQRARVKSRRPNCNCRLLLKPVLIFTSIVVILGALMLLILYFLDKYKVIESSKHSHVFIEEEDHVTVEPEQTARIVGCDHIEVEDVWVRGFPKLLTESAFRLVDVNQDGVLDVIMGFATGADGYHIPKIVCDIYFNGTYPCFGGLLALEGLTGRELWRHYAQHELYGINCNADLNGDGVPDCLGGGRAGTFQAVSGKDGELLWNFVDPEAKNEIMNLYTAQIIRDLDGDGVSDILGIHGGDPLQAPGSAFRLSGRIILFSGKTGKVLRWVVVPDEKESYYSPQTYTLPDGTEMVLFGTGGETHPGALWSISLSDLYKGKIDEARCLYKDDYKGVMTPPVLADLTGDGVEDIVIPMFNSTVLALDGVTYNQIWNHSFAKSESYNTPSPGFYNEDDIPDFMVKYANGPGFPVYFHSETTVLDGKTGQPLIDPPIRDTVGAQASPLTISTEGYGNDVFLYWISDCLEHDGEGGEFSFVEGTNVHEQSRSDFCRLRFKTNGYSKVYALNRHIKQPGVAVYYSEKRKKEEHVDWVNTTTEALVFLENHPEYIPQYRDFLNLASDKSDAYNKPFDMTSPQFNNEEYFLQPGYDFGNQKTSYKKGPFGMNIGHYTLPDSGLLPDYPGNVQIDRDLYNKLQNVLGDIIGKGGTDGEVDDQNPYDSPYQYYPQTNTYPPLYPSNKYTHARSNIQRRDNQKRTLKKQTLKHMIKRRKKRYVKTDKSMLEEATSDPNRYASAVKLYKQLISENSRRKMNVLLKHRLKRTINFKRKRRHIGPHDEDGLQRLLSTGVLAPTSLDPTHPNYNHSIDFIFATYWFFPAKTEVVLPEDKMCVEEKMKNEEVRFDPNSEYYGLDRDGYKHTITHECSKDHSLPDEGTYESQTMYNPFNIHMGQMTVYRTRIVCTCKKNITNENAERCGRVLPYDQQRWRAYMGNNADSRWLQK